MTGDSVTVALRALTERLSGVRRRSGRPGRRGWPRYVLLFDDETTIDAAQQLNFLCYRYGRWRENGTLDVREEGLVYADDLPDRDPAGYQVLAAYADKEAADVGPGVSHQLRLRTRSEFLKRMVWRALVADALIVGFNLPFDLSRLALECGEGRRRYRGGFSFALWQYRVRGSKQFRDDPHRPHVCIKHIDSARAFIGLNRLPGRQGHRGYFLDLKTLAFALTGKKQSLASACDAFGVEHGKLEAERHGDITPDYIAYCRRDVLASQELLERLRAEFDRHPIDLDPWQVFSAASIAKGYLDAMGVGLPTGTPKSLQAAAMLAYFGGRAECRLRRMPVPVRHVDFTSMYPTVNTLMGVFALLSAEHLKAVDATAQVRQSLACLTLERCFEPSFWRELPCFVLVHPDDDILPVRARYGAGDELTIGVNHYQAGEPQWYALADVVASVLLNGGRVPAVRKALRLTPHGRQPDLRPLKIRGQFDVDPTTEDFFQRLVELRMRSAVAPDSSPEERERLKQALKLTANSISYGIFAELNRQELTRGDVASVRVHGLHGAFDQTTQAPEDPGPMFFPLLAALSTAAARLMLAVLERCVTDAGGTYVFVDTDSMSIVASEHGGAIASGIHALTWAQVDAIPRRFTSLNPYDRAAVPGSILELKDVNSDPEGHPRDLWCFAISAKRYAFFRYTDAGHVEIVGDPSEHGLGHLLSPYGPGPNSDRAWIKEAWRWIIASALGLPARKPRWWDQPAIGRIAITSPRVYGPFAKGQSRTPYAQRVKPFNFLLTAHVEPFGHPAGVDPQHFHLVQSYTADVAQAMARPWIDIYSGQPFHITTGVTPDAIVARVKTYGEIITEYATHPEPKSGDPRGGPCTRTSAGLLPRRHVRAAELIYIGKEANRLEDVDAGLVHAAEEVQAVYRDPRDDVWLTDAMPVLRVVTRRTLAAAVGVSTRTIKSYLNGHSRPRPDRHAKLVQLAVHEARRLVRLQSTNPDLRGCAARLLATALARTPSQSRRPPREHRRRVQP